MPNRKKLPADDLRIGPDKPSFDAELRELWCGDRLVKRFKVPAKNQECILKVFEELGWPPCIDDPLLFEPRIRQRTRLKAAIRHLNFGQKNELLKFHGNGRGDGVRWEYIGPF
jgi:hypothetical protein